MPSTTTGLTSRLPELSLLQSFALTARLGSFTRAAERLGLSQASISGRIRTLEVELSTVLFERSTRRVSLTVAGEALLAYAEAMLEIGGEMVRHFEASTSEAEKLRLGFPESFLSTRVSVLLRLLRTYHPQYILMVEARPSHELADMLANGDLDLVVLKRPVGASTGRLLWRAGLYWVGAPRFRTMDGPLPLVLLAPPSLEREAGLAALARAGRSWSIVLQCNGLSAIYAGMEAELGVTVATEGMQPSFIPAPRLIDLPDLGACDIVMETGNRQSAGAKAFSDLLETACRNIWKFGLDTKKNAEDV